MAVRKYKPTTPGRRGASVSSFDEITRSTPEKSLLEKKHRKAGRNVHGRITTRHQGGGTKQRYRVIDFKRNKDGVPAKVAHIEYDPNRSARIALLHYADGEKRYILAPQGVNQGDQLMSGPDAEIRPGNSLPLRNIPVGTVVHAIELKPGAGAKLARSAGASVQLMAKEGSMATVRLPSGETRLVPAGAKATVGTVGNPEHELISSARRAALAGRTSVRPCAGWRSTPSTTRSAAAKASPRAAGTPRRRGARRKVEPARRTRRRTSTSSVAVGRGVARCPGPSRRVRSSTSTSWSRSTT